MPADDATSGETFEDAADDLAATGSRSARALDESMAIIDFPEVSSAGVELRKYQEEKEAFAREAVALRRMLQEMVGQEASVSLHGEEDPDETPLHSMLDDCSRLVLELNSMARAREQEIESLHTRVAEAEVSREVADVYLGSWREGSEQAVGRMLASIDAVVGQDDASFEGADQDGVSILERKTSSLLEKYKQVSMGIEQLEQVLAEVKPGFEATGQGDLATILGIVTEELVSSKRNEVDFLQKLNTFSEEKKALSDELEEVIAARDAANAEASKAKAEFEQMEHKLSTTKEKLSMAVTKGKSLVQHRDSLKQALAEKTAELQSCMAELQKKSDALQAAEGSVEELRVSLDEKTIEHEKCLDELRETYSAWEAAKASIEQLNEANSAFTSLQASLSLKDGVLQHIEEIISEATFPEDLLSLEMADRLGWLIEQKKIADMIFSEHHKVKGILSSVDIPHSVLTGELDSQISWIVSSLNQAKDDVARLHSESADMSARLAAHESKLVSMHEEIDRLTIVLLEEKQEKDMLVNEHSELMSLYNDAIDKLSVASSHNNELIKAFAQFSDVTLEGNEPLDTAKLVQQSLSNIQQRTKSFPIETDSFEKLQTFLYTLDQESSLCKIILEEDMIDRSVRTGELHRMAEEIHVLKNEKDSLQKELERVEERSSLLREKLSMAVKKGKGLVHEREGLKQVLDQKSSEIENLKQVLEGKNSEIEKLKYALNENKSETENMKEVLDIKNSEIEKLKHALDENNSITDNLKQVLDGKNSEIERLKHALDESCMETENLNQALIEKTSEADKIKQELGAKNIDIENLRHEIESRESSMADLREHVEHVSLQSTHFEKLQLDIVTLNDEKGKVESMLEEARASLGTLADSISSIALPVDQPFEEPMEKISQIAQYIQESQVAKSSLDYELHKANEQITLHASRLSDALSTINVLEDELRKVNDHISSLSEEKHQVQLRTAAIEELEKTNEELAISVNKLEDANATINLLQDELSQARSNISILDAEKNEAEVKHETEINALNAKLAKCLEELDRTHGNLQSHSTEHHGYLEKLSMLVMDDSCLSLMAEEFGKTISSLREMGLIVKSLHEQLAAKGFTNEAVAEESELSTLLSLPDYDSFVTERLVNSKTRKKNIDDTSSFSTIVEQLSSQTEYFSSFLKDLSSYMNGNIMLVLHALQLASNNFAHTLEEHGTLKIELGNKDAHNRAQESEVLSLQKELRAMSSKCIYCIQQIKIVFDDVVDLGYAIELATGRSSTRSELEVTVSDLMDEDADDYNKVADALLSTITILKSKSEELSAIKGCVITSLDEFKMRLKQAESAAEIAAHDHQLLLERACMLEKELETLQGECNRMELKMQEYQEREGTLKARELELLSLEHTQITTDRGITDDAISKDQMEALVEKINKLNLLSDESHLQSEEAALPSPIDKFFAVIDGFSAMQREVDTLRYENEDLQLNVESYTREIEQLREVSRNSDLNNRELESKSSELLEVTVSMERMIQRLGYLGGKDLVEDNKPTTTQALLSKLEKLIIASSTEAGNAKSIIQDLGTKLQSREKAVDELSTKVKMLENLYHTRLAQPDSSKDRSFEASSSAIGSDASEIEDVGPMGKASISSVSTAAHARTMRKGSSDHLVLNIGSESERLIAAHDSDDKGRIKSLHTSGLIPAQGKHIADRVDAIWVSGSQIFMNRPRARLGLMVYWLFLHLWLLGGIL
ncbi:intracellular protein transport protein USO1 [Panicum miliaceum]|uniref:Intracellular protein transport protein USO1 n=1 Tax=Panicum miliaceum TaxID=4540 RepID=A0A3L6RVN8_PANMI|nr:intracellular protein transport protein USO1 [Panicum miliaceum]